MTDETEYDMYTGMDMGTDKVGIIEDDNLRKWVSVFDLELLGILTVV